MKQEIEKGKKYLLQISTLREECAKLTFKPEVKENKILNKRSIETQSFHFESKYDSTNKLGIFKNMTCIILNIIFF